MRTSSQEARLEPLHVGKDAVGVVVSVLVVDSVQPLCLSGVSHDGCAIAAVPVHWRPAKDSPISAELSHTRVNVCAYD